MATVLRTKLPVRNATMGWRRPGVPEILWIFGNAVPQFNPDGSVLRVISSFTDISEMKNAEQAIRHLSMQLLQLQDEERRRIGRELHDGMAQTVLAVNLSLAQVRQSARFSQRTRRTRPGKSPRPPPADVPRDSHPLLPAPSSVAR